MLAVTGDRERARAWTRTLMTQLAAWRAPHDLAHADLLRAPPTRDGVGVGKWLPHQRVDPTRRASS